MTSLRQVLEIFNQKYKNIYNAILLSYIYYSNISTIIVSKLLTIKLPYFYFYYKKIEKKNV